MLNANNVCIRLIAELIATLVSSLPGVKYEQLFYRNLEHDKIDALKCVRGDYSATVSDTLVHRRHQVVDR